MPTKKKRSKTTKATKPRKGRKPHQQPDPIRIGRLGQVIPASDPKRTERLRKEALAVIGQSIAKIEGRKPKALPKSKAIPLTEALANSELAQANKRSWDAVTPRRRSTRTTPKPSTDAEAKSNGRLSGLDAAVQVLTAAKQPMRCQDIVNTMLAKKLWSTSGKTPAATIHAAMIREIAVKGKDARFRKVDRGLFTATGKAV